MRSYLARSRPNDVPDLLIGFNIALQSRQPFKKAFRSAFRYFEDGGDWGVVAAILGVRARPLLAQLDDVIDGTGAVAQGADSEAEFTLAAAEAAGGETIDGTFNDGGNDPGNLAGPDPGGGEDPRPSPRPSPSGDVEDCQNAVDCAAKEVLPRPEPSPSPSEDEDEDGGLPGGLLGD